MFSRQEFQKRRPRKRQLTFALWASSKLTIVLIPAVSLGLPAFLWMNAAYESGKNSFVWEKRTLCQPRHPSQYSTVGINVTQTTRDQRSHGVSSSDRDRAVRQFCQASASPYGSVATRAVRRRTSLTEVSSGSKVNYGPGVFF